MKTMKGDLLALAEQEVFEVIIHGCNCFNHMGAGVAAQIKRKFPEAYKADCETKKGDRKKLGTYSFVKLDKLTIINAYTQYRYASNGVHLNYEALRKVFRKIKNDFSGKRIGYPMIGAGLAGGDWDKIKVIIDEELGDADHTMVYL